jgi:hypothetical protein
MMRAAALGLLCALASAWQGSSCRYLLLSGPPYLVARQQHLLRADSLGVAARDVCLQALRPGHRWFQAHRLDTAQFTVVLIGKDGSEKFRSHEPVGPAQLFALIDAMPMRQAELRKKN